MRRTSLAPLLLASALALLWSAPPASAALPGKDGVLVFQSQRTHQALLTRVSASGTGEKALPRTVSGDATPAWNPFGTRLAFERDGDIWMEALDGTALRELTDGTGNSSSPTWSPDGRTVAYSHYQDGATEIWTVDVHSRTRHQLTHDRSTDLTPAWSSKGRIAYVAYAVQDTAQLFAVNADGTGRKDLTNDTTITEGHPDWSPDGTTLVFEHSVDSHCDRESIGEDLYTRKADGTALTALCHHDEADSDGSDPAFSPDGTSIVFSANNGLGSIQLWRSPFPGSGRDSRLTADPNPSNAEASWQPVVPAATGSVRPTTVVRGRTVTVTGAHFARGEQVTLVLRDSAGRTVTLALATVGSSGALSVSRQVPAGLAEGAATLTLTGATSYLGARVPLTLS